MKTAKVEEQKVAAPGNHPLRVERLFKPEEGVGAAMLSGSPEEIARKIADLLAERRLLR